MYHEQRYQTEEVYVSKQIEVDMLLSFTLAKHQLTSQVSFWGGENPCGILDHTHLCRYFVLYYSHTMCGKVRSPSYILKLLFPPCPPLLSYYIILPP